MGASYANFVLKYCTETLRKFSFNRTNRLVSLQLAWESGENRQLPSGVSGETPAAINLGKHTAKLMNLFNRKILVHHVNDNLEYCIQGQIIVGCCSHA